MRTLLIASALSILAILPASAQSCVSGGMFVPCNQPPMGMGAPGMQGGMQGGPAMAGQSMAEDREMAPRKMSRRSAKTRTKRRAG